MWLPIGYEAHFEWWQAWYLFALCYSLLMWITTACVLAGERLMVHRLQPLLVVAGLGTLVWMGTAKLAFLPIMVICALIMVSGGPFSATLIAGIIMAVSWLSMPVLLTMDVFARQRRG